MDNYCVISKSFHTLGFVCISKSCILVDGISSLHMIRHQQQSSLLVTICHVCCKQMIGLKTKQKTVNYFINLLQTTHHHYDNTAASPQASSTQIFWLPVTFWLQFGFMFVRMIVSKDVQQCNHTLISIRNSLLLS